MDDKEKTVEPLTATQNTREDAPRPGSAEEAEARRNIGKGPFSIGKPRPFPIGGQDCDTVEVLDSSGATFAIVFAFDCVGGDKTAAKARATRIAEALNRDPADILARSRPSPDLPEEIIDRVWDRLEADDENGPDSDWRLISREQLADALTESALAAIDAVEAGHIEDTAIPGDMPKPLSAMAHSLECLSETADERGLGGWRVTALRAARFIKRIEKHVTRLLPIGTSVHHRATGADLTVERLGVRESGDVILGGDGWQLSLDECDPIFEIVADVVPFDIGSMTASGCSLVEATALDDMMATNTGTLDVSSTDLPITHLGPDEPTVHHLEVDPDQIVTLHGPWAGSCKRCNSKPCICNLIEQ